MTPLSRGELGRSVGMRLNVGGVAVPETSGCCGRGRPFLGTSDRFAVGDDRSRETERNMLF